MHVALKDLPVSLRNALHAVGFHNQVVCVVAADKYSPSEGSAAFKGNKGFCVAVNLETGETKTEFGSWGGANPFEQRQVDQDTARYPIPTNGAVVIGEVGGRGSFARIKVCPDNLMAMLPTKVELSDQEASVLRILTGYTSSYRSEEFDRAGLGKYGPTNPVVLQLAEKELLKINRQGAISVTIAGRNACQGL